MLTARTVAAHPAALWTFRLRLIEYLPDHVAARFRDYAPVGTFEAAMEGGFQSSTFDLSGNIEDDQRQGLDEVSGTSGQSPTWQTAQIYCVLPSLHLNSLSRTVPAHACGAV